MNLPSEPFFVKPYKEEAGGVDFLGLRQVNLTLIDQFLPGINNVTNYLRPYSVMCWIAWRFKNAAQELGLKELNSSQFKQFREKVEILFNWGHQLTQTGTGMAGNAQVAPNNGAGEIPLKFSDWKRNVSWFDAVNYGPSVKSDSGLSFLTQVLPGIYIPSTSGEQLAIALDFELRKRESYPLIAALNVAHASATIALDLYEAWRVDAPSIKESEIYGHALYDETSIGKDTRLGYRSSSIKLILSAIKVMKHPVTTDELRAFITNTDFLRDIPAKPEKSLFETQTLLRVLQVRQAQRLAFETFFGWVEYRVMEFGRTNSIDLVKDLIDAIKSKHESANIPTWVSDMLASAKYSQASINDLFHAATSDPELNIATQITAISEELIKDKEASAIRALETLILCSVYTKFFLNDIQAEPLARLGGSARISLEYWHKFVESNQTMPLQTFISKVIENFLLSQHFGVAAARYEEGKQRLRLTIEEHGLVSMLNSTNEIWSPFVALDRLVSILALMKDSRLINATLIDGEKHYMHN